jgi:hypothetical protein
MRVANIQVRKEPYYRRAAIEQGLQRLGYTLAADKAPKGRESLLVVWNRKRGADDNAATLWEQRGGTVIVMENGYLAKQDKTYYAISVHGHCGAGWFPVGTEDRFRKLGFDLKPLQSAPDGHWLVCAQRGIGSPEMASPPQWGEKMAARLKQMGKKVRLRPHPGNFPAKVPLLDDLRCAHECVIWSSGAGVRALVEGIPVQFNAPHWICGVPGSREQRLQHMAHGQWHHEEIATGEPFARILEDLK